MDINPYDYLLEGGLRVCSVILGSVADNRIDLCIQSNALELMTCRMRDKAVKCVLDSARGVLCHVDWDRRSGTAFIVKSSLADEVTI